MKIWAPNKVLKTLEAKNEEEIDHYQCNDSVAVMGKAE